MNKILKEKISINGISVNYYLSGNGPKQVLLLHGWGSNFENWKNFLTQTEPNNFQWIFIELPGFTEYGSMSKPWNVDDYLDFCKAFLAKTNLNPEYLMAHSFGARICIKWLNSNHNFKKVVFAGAAGIKNPLPFYKKIIKKITPFLSKYIKTPTQIRVLFYKLIGSTDYYKLSDVMKQTFANVVDEDLTPFLKNIKVPVQLIWGKHDSYTPLWMAQKMKESIPDSNLFVFEDGRHGLHHTKTLELVRMAENFYNT